MGVPARGYSWPPFEVNNDAAVTHGAYSPRKVEPLALEILEMITASGPEYLVDPSYLAALWALARSEARVQLLSEYLAEKGLLDDKGNPRPALEPLYRFERLALEQRGRLGLDPMSRGRLQRDLAGGARDFTLAMTTEEGRKTRLEAEARLAPLRAAALEAESPKPPEVLDA